jgi:hypothetical protein
MFQKTIALNDFYFGMEGANTQDPSPPATPAS